MKTLFDSMVKNEKIHYVLGFNQSQMSKPYVEFKKQKRIQARKKHTNQRAMLYAVKQ